MRKAAFPSRTLARQGGLAGLFFLLSSVAAFAQFDTAAVLGTVRDPKGGAIADARLPFGIPPPVSRIRQQPMDKVTIYFPP